MNAQAIELGILGGGAYRSMSATSPTSITAYRQGATAAPLAAAHDWGLTSVKRLLHTAGRHPLDELMHP